MAFYCVWFRQPVASHLVLFLCIPPCFPHFVLFYFSFLCYLSTCMHIHIKRKAASLIKVVYFILFLSILPGSELVTSRGTLSIPFFLVQRLAKVSITPWYLPNWYLPKPQDDSRVSQAQTQMKKRMHLDLVLVRNITVITHQARPIEIMATLLSRSPHPPHPPAPGSSGYYNPPSSIAGRR